MTNTQKVEAGPSNGRRPEDQNSGIDDDVENDDAEHEVDDTSEDKPKRKRRAVSVTEKKKKYQCPHPDCDKEYSRAEHLSRHNLNHNPKSTYYCNHPGCTRHFVRADLRQRHQMRHTAEGSTLQRREAFGTSKGRASNRASASASATSTSPMDVKPPAYALSAEQHTLQPASRERISQHAKAGASRKQRRTASSSLNDHSSHNNPANPSRPSSPPNGRRFSVDGRYPASASISSNGFDPTQVLPATSMHPQLAPQPTGSVYSKSAYSSSRNEHYQAGGSYPTQATIPSLPPFVHTTSSYNGAAEPVSTYPIPPPSLNSTNQYGIQETFTIPGMTDFNYHDLYATQQALPVFNFDGFNRSPQTALDDEIWQLFERGGLDMEDPMPNHQDLEFEQHAPSTRFKSQPEDDIPDYKPPTSRTWKVESSHTHGMDLSMRESGLSEMKQNLLIQLVRSFGELKDMPRRSMRESILNGDTEDPNHALSVNMIRTCLASYWTHIHQQMPILHRPTFNSDTCPDLLLLTMVCLGACCLERSESSETIKNCAQLALFSAYHIRWEVFKDADFRPTAKLWTFQTMLLLELFEKMYSTRVLHERAHIHHATTLTVMRRGSSLIGRAIEQPDLSDPTRTPPGADGTINTTGTNTGNADWNRWINAEATRRVAFAAFIIDSTHASLFGHAAVMSHTDLRLSLPCNETLWSAPSYAAVQQGEMSLAESGYKPTSFSEGLKRTLNGQKVHTNVFGRVVLMAGLLNVSWHVNQRDLQLRSLGNDTTVSNQRNADRTAKSTGYLTRAFEFWKTDFDSNLPAIQEQRHQVHSPESTSTCHADHHDNVSESGSCLASLAHMSTHVEIVDCEVFAGAEYTLGRKMLDNDRVVMRHKMRAWAPTPRARDATFYAIRFLCDVLMPAHDPDVKHSLEDDLPTFTYSARDDYLLNRPWILYFAVMVVWSYGYALDGPLKATTFTLNSREAQISDMRTFLHQARECKTPDELRNWTGRNECLGLLILMRECLRQSRWELLHEASDMLGRCIGLLMPGNEDVERSFGKKEPAMRSAA